MSESDTLRPWPPYKLVPVKEAADFLGVTLAWMKRARRDGFITFTRLRNTTVVRAADLYRLIEENTVRAAPRPRVTRKRTPEHNARIAESVKASLARKRARRAS
jgi:hypothetical protein